MKRNNIKYTIKEYFFQNPTDKKRVREIERKLNLPLPSVIKYCKELENENILMRINMGNVTFYTSNRTSKEYLINKRLFNIKQLYINGLIEFIKSNLHNPTIIVFGSYEKGEDTENSDIDLYLEAPSKKEIDMTKFQKLLNRKIQIFKFTSIKDVKNHNLANNIINGTVLNGFIEVFK